MLTRFFRPGLILGVVLLAQVICLFLFMNGIIPSFVLDAANLDGAGIALYFLFSFGFLALVCAFTCKRNEQWFENRTDGVYKALVNRPRLIACVRIFLVVSLTGSIYVAFLTVQGQGFFDYLMACVTNQIKASSELENGPFHLLLLFPLANSVLIPILGKDGTRSFVLNLVCLIYLSTAFGSRILLLEGLVLSLLVTIALLNIRVKVTVGRGLLAISVILLMIILFTVVAGYRDFEFSGRYYTDNPLIWGVSRMLDYPCSTLIYTSHFIDLASMPGNPLGIFPSLRRFPILQELLPTGGHSAFLSLYGQSYYTNIGGFTEVAESLGLWSAPFAVLVAYGAAKLYESYRLRSLAGLMFYPVMFYAFLEYWRTFHLGYELLQITVVLLALVYVFIKPRAGRSRQHD